MTALARMVALSVFRWLVPVHRVPVHRVPFSRVPVRLALGLLVALGGGCDRGGADDRPLRVAAAASLRELCEATRGAFETAHPGRRLSFSFDASSKLARQIEASGGYDAFLSADAVTLDRIRDRLAPDSVSVFLSNRMVLVARADLVDPVTSPADLVAAPGRIAVAAEAVPAGRYARRLLDALGLRGALAPRLVSGDNVRATLAMVESGAADYGFVYATDAAIASRARQVWAAEDDDDPGVVYVAAAVAGADPLGADYVRFLGGEVFQAAARARGFLGPASR